MCEPLTISTMAVMAASGAMAADAQQKEAGFQADLAFANGRRADKEAGRAMERGQSAELVKRLEGGAAVAEARARAGSSGVDLTSASTLDVLGDSRMMGELDARTIENNAALEAWGYQTTGENARAQSAATRKAGRVAAASTLIGTAAQIGQAGMTYKLSKVPGRSATDGKTTAGALKE